MTPTEPPTRFRTVRALVAAGVYAAATFGGTTAPRPTPRRNRAAISSATGSRSPVRTNGTVPSTRGRQQPGVKYSGSSIIEE
ncbi:hypothetical protein [Streptomyces goshikiensis]|uniref:hypothetical protein n=1 Tax=Streptomyces goshikiensis TaxID=1942 RepID=UPI0036AFEFBD